MAKYRIEHIVWIDPLQSTTEEIEANSLREAIMKGWFIPDIDWSVNTYQEDLNDLLDDFVECEDGWINESNESLTMKIIKL